jgi:hypothetical protein
MHGHADERAFDLCISLRWLHGHPCFVCGAPEFGEVAVGMEFVSSGPDYQMLAGGGEGGWLNVCQRAG